MASRALVFGAAGLAPWVVDPAAGASLLQVLANPNVAYVLFTIGVLGLLGEMASPGVLVPGAVGALALVLAFVGFAALPVNPASLVLLLVAVALFAAEVHAQTAGIGAAAGLVAFVIGSLMLFARPSPGQPHLRVSGWLVAINALSLVGFFLVVVRAMMRARRTPVAIGAEALIGRTGTALTDLSPAGRVAVDGELWSAVAEDDSIRAGDEVQVSAVRGVTLGVIHALRDADFMGSSLEPHEVRS